MMLTIGSTSENTASPAMAVKTGRVFLSALLAGVCIGLGGTVFLSLENRTVGAVLFTVGITSR